MLSNFNAAAAQGLARQIEDRAREGGLDGCDDLLVALRERIRRLERELDALAVGDERELGERRTAARDA
jgi:HPt (histidine-containing phosphotransfer) domain-containing protein